VYVE
jgi:methionine synthase I (cobalamin-dependent)